MVAKDLHDAVKRALEKDGWTIIDDPEEEVITQGQT
ncbi:MAG: element excision factor XisH family protein [Nodosilinea sp.]